MNVAAKAVVADLPEIIIAYGVSDEYRYAGILFAHTVAKFVLTVPQLCLPQIMYFVRATGQVRRKLGTGNRHTAMLTCCAASLSAPSYRLLQQTMFIPGRRAFPTRRCRSHCQHLTVELCATQVCRTSATT